MARRLSRYALAVSAILVGGAVTPGITCAAGPAGGRKLDLSAVYGQRLGLTAPAADLIAAMPIAATPVQAAPRAVMVALVGVPRVGAAELGRMRAGFGLPNGIFVDFGFTSATFLNGDTTPIQTLNVHFHGGGDRYNGSATTTSNGVTQTSSLTSSNFATNVVTLANQNLTSVQTMIGGAGLTTIIKNQANGQLIQHFQTLNLATTGLKPILDQQVTQAILSNALNAANILRER